MATQGFYCKFTVKMEYAILKNKRTPIITGLHNMKKNREGNVFAQRSSRPVKLRGLPSYLFQIGAALLLETLRPGAAQSPHTDVGELAPDLLRRCDIYVFIANASAFDNCSVHIGDEEVGLAPHEAVLFPANEVVHQGAGWADGAPKPANRLYSLAVLQRDISAQDRAAIIRSKDRIYFPADGKLPSYPMRPLEDVIRLAEEARYRASALRSFKEMQACCAGGLHRKLRIFMVEMVGVDVERLGDLLGFFQRNGFAVGCDDVDLGNGGDTSSHESLREALSVARAAYGFDPATRLKELALAPDNPLLPVAFMKALKFYVLTHEETPKKKMRIEIYRNYQSSENYYDALQQSRYASEFFIGTANSMHARKPYLWIHAQGGYNARDWQSFGSRSSTFLNQPYLFYSIKSILDQCNDSFNVCLIDDTAFQRLLPKWLVEMDVMPAPLKERYRQFALSMLLQQYGGLIVPPSFFCRQDLQGVYKRALASESGVFAAEHAHLGRACVRAAFMGCAKGNSLMKQFVEHQAALIRTDFTAEADFIADTDAWCRARMSVLDGSKVGVKDGNGALIDLADLLSQNELPCVCDALGIYVDSDEVLRRPKFAWFARLSVEQFQESELALAKLLRS